MSERWAVREYVRRVVVGADQGIVEEILLGVADALSVRGAPCHRVMDRLFEQVVRHERWRSRLLIEWYGRRLVADTTEVITTR